jgi:tellurite resistance protein
MGVMDAGGRSSNRVLNAANCVEMAKGFSKAEERLAFLQIAQVWLRLADIAEKFDDIE